MNKSRAVFKHSLSDAEKVRIEHWSRVYASVVGNREFSEVDANSYANKALRLLDEKFFTENK